MKLSSIYNLPITLQQTSSSNPFSLNIVYVYTNILMKKEKKIMLYFRSIQIFSSRGTNREVSS